jgi:hypothetical protein
MLSASSEDTKSWILSASDVVDFQVRSRRFGQEPGFSALSLSGSPEKNGKSAGRPIVGLGGVLGCCPIEGGDGLRDCEFDDSVLSGSEF